MRFSIRIIIAGLAISLANHTVAEQRTAIPGTTAPEAVCSRCEASDIGQSTRCIPRTTDNYCACKQTSESERRVLVRAKKKAPFVSFDQYQAAQLRALSNRLKKRRASKAKIKQALDALRKKLEAQHVNYKKSCGDTSGIIVSPNPPNTTQPSSQTEVITKGPYTIQLLSLSGIRHSFATAISPQGRVLGGAYHNEGSIRAPAMPHGLAQIDFLNQPTTPAVWGGDGLRTGCSTCPNGLYFVDLNDRGFAVGSRLTGSTPAQEAFLFDYNKQAVARISTNTPNSSTATAINDAGIIVGQTVKTNASASNSVLSDAVSWVGTTETLLDRSAIIAAHDKELAPVMLKSIKDGLKEAQDSNECGDAEIEQTTLVGGPAYPDVVSISATEINVRGDILGSILAPRVTWNFIGPCQQGEGQLTILASTFVRKLDGSLTVVPGPIPMYPNDFMAIPTDINSSLTVLGSGLTASGVGNSVATLQASHTKPSWQQLIPSALPPNLSLQPIAINDRGDVAGIYTSFTPGAPDPRGFAIIGKAFVDLTSLLGAGSEWVIETATDINSCGQIVGRARSTKSGVNRAIVLSPSGCPLAK